MKRKLFGLFMISICSSIPRIQAQDFHFSQFYASPMSFNPALTGKFNGNMRLCGIYRMQWNNVNTSSFLYQTPSFSADFNLFHRKLGIGIILLNDQTNNKTFNTLEGGLSVSYKIASERFGMSFGLQGWYSQNYFDYNKVKQNFRQTEPTAVDLLRRFDFNAGLFTDYKLDDGNILYGGISVYHLLRPLDQFSSSTLQNAKLPMKFAGQLGADMIIHDKLNIIPGLMYARQSSASQINTGATLAYYLHREEDNNMILYAGLWSRWNEFQIQALIPKIGYEMKKIRITAAYDLVTNSLANEVSTANSARPNTFEISIIYILKNSERSMDYDCFLFNPRY